ncbi:hypothetical protein F751_6946 [Auxenochlorella protothecoides]|uniref:Uncharacterized protein n=1 Tax=Auxenochlorella protothecoides TaxID=3075 RepID=A0A087SR25_AUXPR|nr:hypothetical protein F751_6946 [Auxenochlorella protothecoides]KFM28179.1 hypothetical protein F751_6946 [Auxenochlorella protothecoides]
MLATSVVPSLHPAATTVYLQKMHAQRGPACNQATSAPDLYQPGGPPGSERRRLGRRRWGR